MTTAIRQITKNKLIRLMRSNNRRINELQYKLYGEVSPAIRTEIEEARRYNIETDRELLVRIPEVQVELQKIDNTEMEGFPGTDEMARTLIKDFILNDIMGVDLGLMELPF